MIDVLNFTFQSFWHFVGIWMLMIVVVAMVSRLIGYFIRHLTIWFRGYPPAHCDVNGNNVTDTEE